MYTILMNSVATPSLYLPALQQITEGEKMMTLGEGGKKPDRHNQRRKCGKSIRKNEMLVTSWKKLKSFQLFNTITRET